MNEYSLAKVQLKLFKKEIISCETISFCYLKFTIVYLFYFITSCHPYLADPLELQAYPLACHR